MWSSKHRDRWCSRIISDFRRLDLCANLSPCGTQEIAAFSARLKSRALIQDHLKPSFPASYKGQDYPKPSRVTLPLPPPKVPSPGNPMRLGLRQQTEPWLPRPITNRLSVRFN